LAGFCSIAGTLGIWPLLRIRPLRTGGLTVPLGIEASPFKWYFAGAVPRGHTKRTARIKRPRAWNASARFKHGRTRQGPVRAQAALYRPNWRRSNSTAREEVQAPRRPARFHRRQSGDLPREGANSGQEAFDQQVHGHAGNRLRDQTTISTTAARGIQGRQTGARDAEVPTPRAG